MTVGTNDPTVDPRGTPVGSHRFAPGAIVGGRYRLVALLGRGGMGEVYRADDLTLDSTVALKFLPRIAVGDAADPDRLARLHNELRVARQVSHKNVCRVYDLGDADGRQFITMEYVDGEDLASLLRRIGRIPQDKAIQIARQLCAGVAAAHERGVLHRDLKPTNVMIDGDGNVRITDFGIATATGEAGSGIAGTPQYMAPELLAGQPASVKSDLYALGLILFEVFTGRRVYEARTLGDIKQLQATATITMPSSIVRDLDPAIESVILRCLERDPDRRPPSALTVAASLPGGDPLAAALAAGETPSPDLLAAAGESEALAVKPALAMTAGVIAILFLFTALASRASLTGLVPMDKPRDVLEDRAQQVIQALGYPLENIDRVGGFVPARDYLQWQQRNGPADWWPLLASGMPGGLLFWYRSSPREFFPVVPGNSVTPVDPPMNVSGMHQVFLDTKGRLVEFHSVPAQLEPDNAAGREPPWRTLFREAGLPFESFTPVMAEWTPRDFADTRAAWEGTLRDRPDIRVHVEAAAFHGQVVSFLIAGPWTQATRMRPVPRTTMQRVATGLSLGFFMCLFVGGALLARANLHANRADRRGAGRLAAAVTVTLLMSGMLTAHQTGTALFGALGSAARLGILVWLLYLAIEPYARRFWPDGLLGWTRLLSGRVLDPRIGRDVLIGLSFGAAGLLLELCRLLPPLFGWREPLPPFGDVLGPLMGPLPLVAGLVQAGYAALQNALVVAMVFVVLRLALKRSGLELAAGVLVLIVVSNNGSALSGSWMDTAFSTLIISLLTFSVYRYGLLVVVVAMFVANVFRNVPLTTNPSLWWSAASNVPLALAIGLACFGYYAARAGQPLFGRRLGE